MNETATIVHLLFKEVYSFGYFSSPQLTCSFEIQRMFSQVLPLLPKIVSEDDIDTLDIGRRTWIVFISKYYILTYLPKQIVYTINSRNMYLFLCISHSENESIE